ncbi:MAG: MFS transporter [Bacilli bacterium]|nr:MFS transporter [Bacilli bacterium]
MKRLSKKQMWIFAIGQLGWSMLSGIITAWLVFFYLPSQETIDSGVKILVPSGLIIGGFLTILGLITALCRLWDAVTDPMVANLSDNCKSKKGRRIPFMKWSAIPFAVITVLVFFAPVSEPNGDFGLNIAWVAIFLVLFYTAMTVYCTPYNALISEFGKTQEDRMYISTAISLTFFAGTLLAYTPFVFGGMLQPSFGYYWAYRICFIVLAVIALVAMLVPCFLLNETDFVEAKPSGTNAFASLASTFQNKEFRVFTASDIMYWIGLTLFQTGLPFFVTVSMKLDSGLTMVFMGAMTVLSAAFYPFVTKLVKKFGKKKLVIAGFLGLALAYAVTAVSGLVEGAGMIFGVIIVLIASFPMALLGIIPQSIVADVAEADSIRTGQKREGMFFAARTFAMKLGQSIAMLAFTSLAILGTTQDVTSNDITANKTGLMIVAIVAVCFCVLGALILAFYSEKKVMKAIAKEGDEDFLKVIENEKDLGEKEPEAIEKKEK